MIKKVNLYIYIYYHSHLVVRKAYLELSIIHVSIIGMLIARLSYVTIIIFWVELYRALGRPYHQNFSKIKISPLYLPKIFIKIYE